MPMPDWAKRLPWDIITDQAKRSLIDIDERLIAAFIQKETGNANYKPRFEPHFRWINSPATWAKSLGISVGTEEILQKMSWGPMQIMGATARDMGFRGDIPELCKPELGIHFGGKYLRWLYNQHRDVRKMIAGYNAGPSAELNSDGRFENQPYVDDVLKYYRELAG